MDLPVRILRERPAEPVITVDGSWNAPGLELSHWPGNRTPPLLRDDLSTGSALRFARLPASEREELARGAAAIVNTHYDTDGSCALFAVRHPELALPREDALREAARAGDFFELKSERALAIDATVTGLACPERSPIAGRFAGMDERGRHEAATHFLLEALPGMLDGDLGGFRELWEPVLEGARADLADLERCARDEIAHLDWAVWTAPEGHRSGRPGAVAFDPGRHALFGRTRADRALAVGPGPQGATYRFILSTLSWFDLVSRPRAPRPDLALLAERLNELEGSDPASERAWRFQEPTSPSPELWFGAADHDLFAEHCPALRPSRLPPALVRRQIADALRAVLPIP